MLYYSGVSGCVWVGISWSSSSSMPHLSSEQRFLQEEIGAQSTNLRYIERTKLLPFHIKWLWSPIIPPPPPSPRSVSDTAFYSLWAHSARCLASLTRNIKRLTIVINPCPAELLQFYFSSFEAGIANAISSFKWRKILLLMKNRHVWK